MHTRLSEQTRFVVGVAGGSGSGKTRFTNELLEALPNGSAQNLEHDSYYLNLSNIPEEVRVGKSFDHPEALESSLLCRHIRALRNGESIEKPSYCFKTSTRRSKTVTINPSPVLVVEGLFTLAEPRLREQFDLRIFIDTPADIRILRRIKRDIEERGRTVKSVTEQYVSSVRPAHEQFVQPSIQHAEVIAAGNVSFESTVKRVAARIEANLKG